MAVFAIAGVALLGVAQSNFVNLSQLEQKTIAGWVASNQLTAASLETSWPPKNNRKGQVEMAGGQWHWVQKVLSTQDSRLKSVTIEVRQTADQETTFVQPNDFFGKA